MRIVQLTAENIKRLTAVQITPDGNMVEITGRNGQGKTSVLDSIWWALAGTRAVQTAPIRDGEEQASIRLDLGDLIVTRTFRRRDNGPEFTTSLKVESADGASYKSPQSMLDGLVGELSFDPLEFTRLPARDQFDRLRRFVPGVDFDALDAANDADYDRRRDLNRRVAELRAQAVGIEVPAGLPDAPVDEDALAGQMADVARHNSDVERRRSARQQAEDDARRRDEDAAAFETEAKKLRVRAAELDADAETAHAEAADIRANMAKAPALPALLDVDVLQGELRDARTVNLKIAARGQRDALVAEADRLAADAETLTETMDARAGEKRRAVAAAQMPVAGLGFGDGSVTLDGVPFGQASDAEQLRASVAIAMAGDPKLRVIRVRDGSLLDDESMVLLAKLADEHDCQVWVERVDSSGQVGVVIEDGAVRDVAQEVDA